MCQYIDGFGVAFQARGFVLIFRRYYLGVRCLRRPKACALSGAYAGLPYLIVVTVVTEASVPEEEVAILEQGRSIDVFCVWLHMDFYDF